MSNVIEKIGASDPSITGDDAKLIFDELVLDPRFVWFSDVLLQNVTHFALHQLIDKFIYGMAGVIVDEQFFQTSQPMHILQFSTPEDETGPAVVTTVLVYANGLVVHIASKKELTLLLIDKDTCSTHQIDYTTMSGSDGTE